MASSAGWRVAVAALCALGLAGVGTWALAGHDQHELAWIAVTIVGSGFIALGALRPLASAPSGLRWDGAAWHLRSEAGRRDGSLESAGTLQVTIDLGDWMLVRFVTGSGWRRRVAWLALQRSSQGANWHALRCAVFASRGAPDAP